MTPKQSDEMEPRSNTERSDLSQDPRSTGSTSPERIVMRAYLDGGRPVSVFEDLSGYLLRKTSKGN